MTLIILAIEAFFMGYALYNEKILILLGIVSPSVETQKMVPIKLQCRM